MKTIELKWIEDDNHVVAEDAYTGLKDLIDTGVFKTLSTECKDDVLYITGEQDELDKAVMKIQKAYAKYGQIMIKESKKEGGLRIESYDDNVQEIFDYTVKEFDKLKENKHSADYITKLGDLQMKFKRLKEAAGRKDKAIIQDYLDEISTLTENAEIKKIKPIRTKIEESTDPDTGDTVDDVIEAMQTIGFGPAVSRALVKDNISQVIRLLKNGNSALDAANVLKKQYLNEDANNELRMHLSNPANWGIIEEGLNRTAYNRKFDKVARLYADETGLDIDDAYDELMDNDELLEYVDSDLNAYQIVDKLLNESTMNESFDWNTVVEPFEFKKTIQEINSRMNLSNIIDITSNHNSIFVNTDPFTYTIHLNKKYLWIEKSDVNVYKQKLDNGKVTKSDLVDVLSFINTDVRDMKRNVEESTMNESWLSPAELKKKLQRVAMKWASEEGIKYEVAYNDLRKRKSVKDMLDFYTVEEIIDDLKKKKKEVDDKLEAEEEI